MLDTSCALGKLQYREPIGKLDFHNKVGKVKK